MASMPYLTKHTTDVLGAENGNWASQLTLAIYILAISSSLLYAALANYTVNSETE